HLPAPRPRTARRRGGRGGPRPGGRGLPRAAVRGHGTGRLLLRGGRSGAPPQRGQHDPRVHTGVDVPAGVGGLGPDLRRTDRRAGRPRDRAAPAAQPLLDQALSGRGRPAPLPPHTGTARCARHATEGRSLPAKRVDHRAERAMWVTSASAGSPLAAPEADMRRSLPLVATLAAMLTGLVPQPSAADPAAEPQRSRPDGPGRAAQPAGRAEVADELDLAVVVPALQDAFGDRYGGYWIEHRQHDDLLHVAVVDADDEDRDTVARLTDHHPRIVVDAVTHGYDDLL